MACTHARRRSHAPMHIPMSIDIPLSPGILTIVVSGNNIGFIIG